MGDALEEVLRANEAFYDAFASGDIEGMDELWARALPVACVHPGWEPLHGREEVMASWRAILLGGNVPPIRCEEPRAFLVGDAGYVTCIERIRGEPLVATNIYALEDGVWQLVHHHASAIADEARGIDETPPPQDRLN